jgi:hypothetical protein
MKRGLRKRVSFGMNLGLSAPDSAALARLSSPEKIQDFVSSLDINREKAGDTCLSVSRVLAEGHAHCIEGAFVAACALWMGGSPPLLMDMQAEGDHDHVIALFRSHGCWGAISKSNHVWLRWRDPVYRNPRELAMSYFHEYNNKGRKSLRTYSDPIDLRQFDIEDWVINEDDCWHVGASLEDTPHHRLITPVQARNLRRRDATEMRADDLVQYESADRKRARRY